MGNEPRYIRRNRSGARSRDWCSSRLILDFLQMNTHDIELPPLPKASKMYDIPGYDEEELKAYARAAIEADRKRRGEPTAAEISNVVREITGCPDIKSGEKSLVVSLGMLFNRYAIQQHGTPKADELPVKTKVHGPLGWIANTTNTKPVAWPLASPEDADKGWTLDYHFLDEVERIASQRTNYTTSAEATEQVLIAAAEVLGAQQPAEPCASSVSDKTACGSENGDCDSQPAEPVKRKRRYAQGTALGEFGIIPMCDQVDDEPVEGAQ